MCTINNNHNNWGSWLRVGELSRSRTGQLVLTGPGWDTGNRTFFCYSGKMLQRAKNAKKRHCFPSSPHLKICPALGAGRDPVLQLRDTPRKLQFWVPAPVRRGQNFHRCRFAAQGSVRGFPRIGSPRRKSPEPGIEVLDQI